jgi:hypothetical protein
MRLQPTAVVGAALLLAGVGLAALRALAPGEAPGPQSDLATPTQPALDDVLAPAPGGAAPVAASGAARERATPAPARTPAQQASVPLEKLLGVEQSRTPSGLDAQRVLREAAAAPARSVEPAGKGGLADKLRVQHRSESLPETAPREGKVSQTDLEVALPVGASDSLRLRGGVRLDQAEQGPEGTREIHSAPTIGIEKRF